MSFLASLLEVQDLDVAGDAARRRSATLSEREALPELATKLVEIESGLAETGGERSEKQAEEERIGLEVAQIVRDIEAAEVERYSGKRKNQDEAAAHDASQQSLRERQADLEERELELLEEIEAIEDRVASLESTRAANRVEATKLEEAIQKVETEVATELDSLAASRGKLVEKVPVAILAAYERVRAQPQKGGRGAAMLEDGRCGGCRIKLPSLEKTRMLAEPEDAVIQCPQCRRVLVR